MTARPLVAMAFALLVVALVLPVPVGAHAEYRSSNPTANGILPEPPTSVSITFSESVQPGSEQIRVTNASGDRFDAGSPTLSAGGHTASVEVASVGPGIYEVVWGVVSAVDGHFTSGSFAFAVQNPDGTLPGDLPFEIPVASGTPVSAFEVVLRFLGFLGLSVALGAAVLGALVWLPAARDPDARGSSAFTPGLRTTLHWGRVGAFVFALAMAGLWIQVAGLDGTLSAAGLLGSPYLLSVLARAGLAAALFFVLTAAFARSSGADPANLRTPIRMSVVLGLAAIVAGSAGTHAAANPTLGPSGIAADAAHLTGAALWVGGLVGIVALRSLLRDPESVAVARHVYGRFSRLAGYAVLLVLGGGAALAVLLVGSWEALVGTGYGWIVLAKIGLFVPMLAVGAYNRYRLVPATADDPGRAVRILSRNVRGEALLGAAVLALAGLLTAMVPAVNLAAPPGVFTLQATSGGLRLDFSVYPYPTTPGTYTFVFLLYNETTGATYDEATTGTATFRLTDGSLPPRSEQLDGPHGNHFITTTPALSQPGVWRIDALFERPAASNVTATFHVAVSGGT